MKDTPETIETKFRAMVLARSPAERLSMACGMFATAKTLVKAGILQEDRDLDPGELRQQIFLRLYGDDFDETDKAKILAALTPS